MMGMRRSQRWLLAGATASVMAVVGVAQATAAHRAPAADSVAPVAAVPATMVSQTPSVSADGRFVVYVGRPTAAGDTRAATVFLQDRVDGSVTELTAAVDGLQPGESVWPVISADGCVVAVTTELGLDLFRDDDTGARWDVYALRLPACGGALGDWELVSTGSGQGFEASASDDVSPLYPAAISGEGALVAYTHRFNATSNDLTAITLVDLTLPLGELGRIQPVAGQPAEGPITNFRYHGLREPVLSDDGNLLAFTSDAVATSPLGEWATGPQEGEFATSQIYVWDRADIDPNTNVRLISMAPGGEPSGQASSAALSGDGRYVAFVSTASNLVPGATLPTCNPDCLPQVYLFDRTDGALVLGSREPGDPTAAPVAANLGATQPSMNRSGSELFYVTRSTNLFATRSGELGGALDGDIVVSVPAIGTVQRLNTLADGVTPGPAVNAHPKASANGRVVVFDTLAGAAFGGTAVEGRQIAIIDSKPVVNLANLDLGTVAVGYPGPEWFLVLSNQGPSSFIPALVDVDNPDFIVSGGTCVDQNTTPVPPGGACTINLMLSPSKEGTIEGLLTVHEFGFGATELTAQLTGAGGNPALAPVPAGAEAHPMVVGTRDEPMSFNISNVAFNPVGIRSVKVQGSNPDDFVIATDNCTGHSVNAADICTIDVVFAPTGAGRRTASVVVTTTEGAYTTMIVSGNARWDPKLALGTTNIIAPSRVQVVGAGFAPNVPVTIAWADGLGRPVTVTSDGYGGVLAELVVRPNDRPGARTIVAQTADGEMASADATVVVPTQRTGPGSANWPRPRPRP